MAAIDQLLRTMLEKGGSDLFITAGVPPSMKVNGKIMPVSKTPMSPEMTRETVHGVMNEQQRREFTENHECNFAISARGIGRFRVSAFYQRNLAGMVLRRIETTRPDEPAVLWYLGMAAAKDGRRTEALDYWRRLRAALPPGNPDADMVRSAIEALEAPRPAR